ncbi:MAG: LamG-like jellyroll fold domain-containing protein, partial [Methylococcales bacterium]
VDTTASFSVEGDYVLDLEATDGELTTNAQVTITVNATTGSGDLLGYWMLDDGSGTVASDSSGNGNNGTLTNGPIWNGSELVFDGENDYVNLGTLDVSGSEMTLTGWVQANQLENCSGFDCRIISKATGTATDDHYWMVGTTQVSGVTRLRFRLKANGSTKTLVASSGDLTNGDQFHFAAVYDGSTMRLYKDGVEVGSVAKTGGIDTNNSVEAWIGGNPTIATDRPWEGSIANIRVYQKALSTGEISTVRSSDEVIDTTSPLLLNIGVTGSESTAIIAWDTSEVADSDLSYGPSSAYENGTVSDGNFVVSHSVSLAGLIPDTTYHYQIVSTDINGNSTTSSDLTFTTFAVGGGSDLLIYDLNGLVTQNNNGFPRDEPPLAAANGDWTTPINYAEGTLHIRAEVRNQPVPHTMQIQLCIWQFNLTLENCAPKKNVEGTPNFVRTWEGAITGMFMKNGLPIEWDMPRQRYGLAIKNSAGVPISDSNGWNWGGLDPNEVYPLDMRFTVVVVAKDQTFSGWENFVDNIAPAVDAGLDQTITLPSDATLDGTVSDDDGMPTSPGIVTTLWTVVSGPGAVTFGDPTQVDTTASFNLDGTYVLNLVADDGELTTDDTITITVNTAGTGPETPNNLTSVPISTSRVDLFWDAPTNSPGITGYDILRDSVLITTATNTSFSDTGLTAGQNHNYEVVTKDSNGNGSIPATTTSTVLDTTNGNWWNVNWPYRLLIGFGSGNHERTNRIAEIDLDFSQFFVNLGETGAFDSTKIRCHEVNASGTILTADVACQFDPDSDFDAQSNATGKLIILASGTTVAESARYFHIYFDAINGTSTTASVAPLVTVADNITDEAQLSYRVTNETGDYYYQKDAGGFSSLVDNDNNDWINFHPTGGTSGNFRGIPNLVQPPDGYFHPGNTASTSTLLNQGPLKATIHSITTDGWEAIWEIYPWTATMTVLATETNQNYWFLYEGTPGGSLEPAIDFIVRSNGLSTLLSESWTGDLTGDEWAYIADPNVGRSLFLVNHQDDTAVDSYRPLNGEMTVFGFGRQGNNNLLQQVPAQFTIGLIDSTSFGPVSSFINSSVKPADTVSSGAIEMTP